MQHPGEVATCSSCGKQVAANLTIRLGGRTVCMQCKNAVARDMAGAAPMGSFRYAGFWIRFVARLVDGILLAVVNMAYSALIVGLIVGTGGDPVMAQIAMIPVYFVGILYETLMTGRYGGTLGKMAVKIKVVRPDGQPLSYGRSLGRAFAEVLSGILCQIGNIMAAFDPEKRGLHDRMCDTRVVYR